MKLYHCATESATSGHFNKIWSFLQNHKTGNRIMMGDFNLRYVNWPARTLKPGTYMPMPNRAAIKLLFYSMYEFFLNQIVLEPKTNDKTTLNPIFAKYAN